MKVNLNNSPDEFIQNAIETGITRGYVVLTGQTPQVSNQELSDIYNYINTSPDYQGHEGIFWAVDPPTKSLYIAAIHRTNRGAGQGGTRMQQYSTLGSLFTDAIRLAKGMTDKNACANLWWGGGKSVIHSNQNPRTVQGEEREAIFANFGRFIASLNGAYVCAEDMNTTPEDMRVIHANNRFCTCIPQEIGGSSNPSIFTARGVFMGLVAGVHHLDGKNDKTNIDLSGKHILIQGAGNVGWSLMEQVVNSGGHVTVFDISEHTKQKIRDTFTSEQVVIQEDLNAFYQTEADIFAPCAIGAIINDETIPLLNVKMIAGAANNQLKDAVLHAEALHAKGILYLPDFIINRMGIVNCANEQYGYLVDTIEEKILEVYDFTLQLLERANTTDTSPEFMAMQIAEQLSRIDHPIWGHRGMQIIKQLVKDDWGN
jgi:glutamate dehydrogenase/leucine dehydrogenase